jgi:hypothetical protein
MVENISLDQKIEKAFQLILCRQARSEELSILKDYFGNEQKFLSSHTPAAGELIKAGEFKHEKIEDKTSLAALEEVIMTIYNMDEAITKS